MDPLRFYDDPEEDAWRLLWLTRQTFDIAEPLPEQLMADSRTAIERSWELLGRINRLLNSPLIGRWTAIGS